jgi:hypothetical protein
MVRLPDIQFGVTLKANSRTLPRQIMQNPT